MKPNKIFEFLGEWGVYSYKDKFSKEFYAKMLTEAKTKYGKEFAAIIEGGFYIDEFRTII